MKKFILSLSLISLFLCAQDKVSVTGSNQTKKSIQTQITLENNNENVDSDLSNDFIKSNEQVDSAISSDNESSDSPLVLDDSLAKTNDTKDVTKIAEKIAEKTESAKPSELNKITRFIRPSGIFSSLLLIIAMGFVLKFLHRTVERLGKQFTNQRLLIQKVETFVQFCIYGGTALCCFLLVFEVNQQLLNIIGGTMAVSFGFAVKDLVASFIAGITIMIDVPFQVGDRVNFNGHYGDITAIGLRSVRMQTLSDDVVTIPNNKFLSDVTICGNYGELSMQVVMDFYIGMDQDVAKARKIVNEAAASSHYTHLPKPIVVHAKQQIIENYMSFNITLKAYVLDTQYEKHFVTDINLRVMEAFQEADIQAPAILHRNV